MCMLEEARADCQGGGQGALYRHHVPATGHWTEYVREDRELTLVNFHIISYTGKNGKLEFLTEKMRGDKVIYGVL